MIHERLRFSADGELEKMAPAEATIDGPSAELHCPGCGEAIRTSKSRVGTIVPIECGSCGWEGKIRLHLPGEDPPKPERDTVATSAESDGPSAVFSCPGCGGDARTSKSRIGEGPTPFRHECGWEGAVDIRETGDEDT